MNATETRELVLEFDHGETVSEENEDKLTNMEIGVIYKPINWQFPVVDLVWKDGTRGACAIQVTFGREHKKDVTAFRSLYARLGLLSMDKLTVYFVPSRRNIEHYAKMCQPEKSMKCFIDGNASHLNVEFFCLTADCFSSDRGP